MLMILPEMPMYPQAHGKTGLLLVSMLMLFVLTACGQKGDLYRPGDEQSAVDSASRNV
jgi:predicted small lipoprotein YifL